MKLPNENGKISGKMATGVTEVKVKAWKSKALEDRSSWEAHRGQRECAPPVLRQRKNEKTAGRVFTKGFENKLTVARIK